MDSFVKLLRNANHVGRHLTQGEIEAAAEHIESLLTSRYYRLVDVEERALVLGFELGWKERDATRAVTIYSIEYIDRRDKVLDPVKAKMREERWDQIVEASDGVDTCTVTVTGRNADGTIDTDTRVLAHGGVRDPRKEPHEYVTVENHQGCGVCGFGIGAAVHNLHAAGWRKEHGGRWVRPGEKVLQFEQVLSLALRARLDRIALTEFVLIVQFEAIRMWYDPIDSTILREIPVESSAALWFTAKLPKVEP